VNKRQFKSIISLDIVPTDREETAFKDVNVALFIGSMPHKEGVERKDLFSANVKIFKSHGTVLNKLSKKTVKVNIFFISLFNSFYLLTSDSCCW
jgi:malate/lactate dehydrogenase